MNSPDRTLYTSSVFRYACAMTDPASERRFRKNLPKALVLLRESRDLSQQELAQRLGVHASVLSRYETGARTPALVKLSELLKALVSSWGELGVALAEVRRARAAGEDPSAETMLLQADRTQDDLLVELLAATRQGRGKEFVDRLMERARYAAYLQARLKTHLALHGEELPAVDGEAGDDSELAANGNGSDPDDGEQT